MGPLVHPSTQLIWRDFVFHVYVIITANFYIIKKRFFLKVDASGYRYYQRCKEHTHSHLPREVYEHALNPGAPVALDKPLQATSGSSRLVIQKYQKISKVVTSPDPNV